MRLRQGYPIEALAPALAPPVRLGVQESSLAAPLVYAAAGPHEVGLWDVEQGRCHQVRSVRLETSPEFTSLHASLLLARRRSRSCMPISAHTP